MATNLKLEIFRVLLKEKGKSNDETLKYKDFFNLISTEKEEAYRCFIEEFIKHFSNEFKDNADNTKGISVNSNCNWDYVFQENIINGEVVGGNKGMNQDIFEDDNATQTTGKLSTNNILSLPFFFKFWTPYDYNLGVLMIQSYSGNNTVSNLIKKHIDELFKERGYSLIMTPFIPEKIKKEYLDNSHVYEIALFKDTLTRGKRKKIHPIFAGCQDLKVEIRIKGFNKDAKEFNKEFGEKSGELIGVDLRDFDIKEREDYNLKAYYKDANGHNAHIGYEKKKSIKPTIFLSDSLKKDDIRYDFKEMVDYTQTIIEDIKREIKYVKT